jgi:SAM-dependent methyltransferase
MVAELIRVKIEEKLIPCNARVMDVGCASGALIGYLSTLFPEFSYTGIDISEELIVMAKAKVPTAQFRVESVFSFSKSEVATFDLVLFFGIFGIFDEVEALGSLERLISITKPGGFIYAFSQFNEFNIDVILKYRRTDPELQWDGWGVGWNIYSRQTINKWLANKTKCIRFIDFKMNSPLPPQENPIRSWTIPMGGGNYQLVNGLKLLIDFSFLEIQI